MKQAPRPDIPEVTGVQDLLERLRLSSEQKRTQQQQQTAGTDPTSVLFGSPHTPQENGYFSRRNSHGSMDSFWDEVRSAVGDQDEDAPEPSAAPLAQPALPGPESDFGPSGSDSSEENTAARDADIQSALEVLGQGLPLSQDAAAVSAAEPHVQAQPQHSTRPPDPQDTQAVEISPAAPAPATTSHHLAAEIASPVNSDELLLMSEMENLQAESGFTQLGDDVRYPSPGGTFSSSEHQSGISSGSGQLTPSATIPARLTASHLSTFTTTAADSMLTDVESCFEDSDTDDEGLLKHTTVRSAKESLEHLELIGRGAFGSVYRGTWKGKLVAVKVVEGDDDLMMLPGPHDSDEYLETASRRSCSSSALLEAAVSSAVNHPNVVQTYDYRVFDPDAQVLSSSASFRSPLRETRIIMEFCDAGCLEEAVRDGRLNARTSIGLHHICKTLMEVVDAMLYLHRLQVTHRDLKPKNVLLQSCRDDSRGFVAKVSDFGLSKLLPENNNNKGSMFPAEQAPAGTVTHMSPEALAEGALSTAADVYAFGIMMWEVWTGRAPFQRLSKMQVMLAVVNEALRPEFPVGCPAWYVSLAAACWQQDPKQRITFEEVRRILRARYWEGPSLIYHQ